MASEESTGAPQEPMDVEEHAKDKDLEDGVLTDEDLAKTAEEYAQYLVVNSQKEVKLALQRSLYIAIIQPLFMHAESLSIQSLRVSVWVYIYIYIYTCMIRMS